MYIGGTDMIEVNKHKIIAIIVAILSMITFFVLISIRKYDPLLNIFKLVTLSLSLLITSMISTVSLVKGIKEHKKFIQLINPIVDLAVCLLVLPIIALIVTPESNLLNIDRKPLYFESVYYDHYHNLIYSNQISLNVPEVIVVQNDPSILQLQFIEILEDSSKTLQSLTDIWITYDDQHRILTYDLQSTLTYNDLTNPQNILEIYSRRLTTTNTYSLNTFTSVQDSYSDSENILLGDTDFDITNHHEFAPEEAYRYNTTSTRTLISTNHYEYEIVYTFPANDSFLSYTKQVSQISDGNITTLTDSESRFSVTMEEDHIEAYFHWRYSPYDLGTLYNDFEGIPLMQNEHTFKGSDIVDSVRKLTIYRSSIDDSIYLENNQSLNELITIRSVNFGYVIDYYNSEVKDNRGYNLTYGYLDYYYLFFRSRFDGHRIDVIYPNIPLFWD